MTLMFLGTVELKQRVGDLTPRQREQFADILSGLAADILKGTPDPATRTFAILASEDV